MEPHTPRQAAPGPRAPPHPGLASPGGDPQAQITLCLSGGREHVFKDTEPESISDSPDLALPPEMPILIDFHALKDILGPPMYDTEVSVLFCRWPQRVAGWPGAAVGVGVWGR